MITKYKAVDLNIQEYGNGRKKLFIMYADYTYEDGIGPRWHTRVYPDVRGNKANAVKEALEWLNGDTVGEPWVMRNSPKKIQLAYHWGW